MSRAGNPGEKTIAVQNASREFPQQVTRRDVIGKKNQRRSTPLHSAMLEEEGSGQSLGRV